jgi:hypothetical protein
MRDKLILVLDFDGCVHSYKSGWKGHDIIPDPPVPGVFEWMEKTLEHFDIHVYSARSETYSGRMAMKEYIKTHSGQDSTLSVRVTFTDKKPKGFITIDDRCIRFDGDWTDPQFDPQTVLKFTPWYMAQK